MQAFPLENIAKRKPKGNINKFQVVFSEGIVEK